MSIEYEPSNPEQFVPPMHEEPHFVFPSNLDEATRAALLKIYAGMREDPQGHLESLAQFKDDPLRYRAVPDWYLLTDRGVAGSYPLHVAFHLDNETTNAVIADKEHHDLRTYPTDDDPDGIARKMRIRAFEIFLDRLRVAREIGNTSLGNNA